MRLKRLTLHGFKSFADKTEFSFDDGLTGIIGPNGCGKSNVVDAVKWVLGDQRPTSLRGKEMLDVIFNGAEGRPPMGLSEVLLHLEQQLPEGQGIREMTVGRRLFRSGESEYLLDGRVVRLKDVREALMDTGLGVGAYSVMEQGKIDAVLSANPEERRSIFDEAAGISRYKVRRKEALRKLDKAEQNLARISDLRAEKQSRVRSLKIQATKARNWRETAERLRAQQCAVALVESQALGHRLAALEADLERAGEDVAAAEAVREASRAALLDGESRSRALGQRLRELEELRARVRGLEERRRHECETGERRRTELEALATRGQEALADLDTQARDTREAVAELERGLIELQTRKRHLDAELPVLQERSAEARRAHREASAERERLSVLLLEVLQERTMAKNRVRDEELAIEGLRARTQSLSRQRATLIGRRDEGRSEAEDDLRRLQELGCKLGRAERLLQHELRRGENLSAEKRGLLEALHRIDREASSLRSRMALLDEIERAHEGLGEGARELLDQGRGVLGRLVEYVDCPLELGPALEVALGERVQALVLDGEDRCFEALAALGDRRGSLVLLRGDASAEDRLPEHHGLATLDEEGAPLLSFLRIRGPARAALDTLLAGVVLVPDLDCARRLAVGGEDLVFVTPAGELCDGAWLLAGRAEPAAGPIQRRSALEAMRHQSAALEAELVERQLGHARLEARLERRIHQRRRLEAVCEGLSRQQGLVEHSLETRARQQAEVEEQIARLEHEAAELDDERLQCLVRMHRPLLDGMLLARREQDHERRKLDLQEIVVDLELEAQRALEALALLQRQDAALVAELQGLRDKLSLQQHKLTDLGQRQAELRTQVERAGGEVEELGQALALWRSQAVDQACQGRFLAARLELLEDEYEELEGAAEERRRDAERREAELEEARERRAALRLEEREGRLALVRLDEECRTRHGVELARLRGEVVGYGIWRLEAIQGPPLPAGLGVEVLAGPPAPPDFYEVERELPRLWEEADFSTEAAREEVRILQARLSRMGSVNLEAEDELARLEAEYAQLEQDCQDLEAARRELLETIRDINLRSREQFQATFEEARTHFQEIFRMLFQGGKADMELLETDDPLEAGIEIYARPPGKELRSIRLLSGGERSLTALAILFAVFKVKPSPFCILDEVDAALDEANVERFLRVLAGFVRHTQFLVVTHHKRTMAECEVLYGITMQRKGISSRMAVSLAGVETGEVDRILAGSGPRDIAAERRVAGEEAVGFGGSGAD